MSSPSSSFLERNALSIFLAAGVVAVFSVFMFGSGLPGNLQGDSASQAPLTASVPQTTTTTDAPAANTTADAPALLDATNTGMVPGATTPTTDTPTTTTTPAADTTTPATDTTAPAGTKPAAPVAETPTAGTTPTATPAPEVQPATTTPVLDTITDTSATTGTGAAATMVTFTPKVVADSELLAAVLPKDFSGNTLTAGDAAMGGPDDVIVNDLRPAAQVTTTPLAAQPTHLASSGPLETALAALALALLLGYAAHRVFGRQLL